MKKLIILLSIVLIVLSGCAEVLTFPEKQMIDTMENQPLPIEVKILDTKVYSQIGESIAGQLMGVKPNGKFLVYTLSIKNKGTEAIVISDTDIKLIDSNKKEYSASSEASFYLKESFSFVTINPDNEKIGKIAFDVVDTDKKYDLIIKNSAFNLYS